MTRCFLPWALSSTQTLHPLVVTPLLHPVGVGGAGLEGERAGGMASQLSAGIMIPCCAFPSL